MCSWENYWTGCHILKYLFCFSGSTVKCGCPHSEVWFMCSVFWPALSSFPATLLFLLSLGYVVYIYFSPNSDVLTWNVLSSLPAIQNMSFQGPALFNSFGNLLAISVLSYFPHLISSSPHISALAPSFICSVLDLLTCVQLFVTPRTVALPAPQPMEFPRQEYWSGLPFPPLWDLPDPGIEPASPALTNCLPHCAIWESPSFV